MTNVAERTGLTADSGWGCMLRTGQCLLANALVHHHLGRGASSSLSFPRRISADPTQNGDSPIHYSPPPHRSTQQRGTNTRRISRSYNGSWTIRPLRLRLASIGWRWRGMRSGRAWESGLDRVRRQGQSSERRFSVLHGKGWLIHFGRTLTNGFPPCGLTIVTATDSTIYASEVVAASHQEPGEWSDLMDTLPVRAKGEKAESWGGSGVLILAGVRLGMQGVNPLYHDSIKVSPSFDCVRMRLMRRRHCLRFLNPSASQEDARRHRTTLSERKATTCSTLIRISRGPRYRSRRPAQRIRPQTSTGCSAPTPRTSSRRFTVKKSRRCRSVVWIRAC